MHAIAQCPHVLRLIGHVFNAGQTMLVLEYCENGDLLSYLRKNLQGHKHALNSVRSLRG